MLDNDTRVLVVGPSLPRRETREALEASGLHVVGHVRTPAAIPRDEAVDVVLVTDDGMLDELGDDWRARVAPALVVLSRDDQVASALASLGLRGWAIAAPDTSPADLAAAIVAAASGFAVRPAAPEGTDTGESVPLEALTAREHQVLELVSEGLPNKAIAARLGISDHTVKFHLSSIFSKLGVSTRTEAVRTAVRAGLVNL